LIAEGSPSSRPSQRSSARPGSGAAASAASSVVRSREKASRASALRSAPELAVLPALDPGGQDGWVRKAEPCKLKLKRPRKDWHSPGWRISADKRIETATDRIRYGGEFAHQRRAVWQAVQPGDGLERGGIGRQAVGLLVGHHLQAVFERAEAVVALAQRFGILGSNDARTGQRIERGARAALAQRRVAAAVDQLVGLREELDLANAAAPALEVVSPARLADRRHSDRGCAW